MHEPPNNRTGSIVGGADNCRSLHRSRDHQPLLLASAAHRSKPPPSPSLTDDEPAVRHAVGDVVALRVARATRRPAKYATQRSVVLTTRRLAVTGDRSQGPAGDRLVTGGVGDSMWRKSTIFFFLHVFLIKFAIFLIKFAA